MFSNSIRALSVSALALCAAGSLPAQSHPSEGTRRTIQAGGVERSYLLHRPSSLPAGRPLPLLLVFHGAGGQGAGMARHTGLAGLGVQRGYAVVHPDGLDRRWNDGRGNSGAADVEFIRLLLDSLGRELPVDTRRVYAAGISNGAGFAYRLACDLPGVFSAVAAVAGAPAAALEERCAATRPVSVVAFQGTRDPLMPYQGGNVAARRGRVLSAPRAVALFAEVDACAPSPTVTTEPDSATDGTRVRRSSYAGCGQGREVVLYTIAGGGHTWPGGPPVGRRVGRVTRDIDASRVMLDFFDRHPDAEPGPPR
ncbi:MAG: extracellular catalytic domain type 1 short-chain-length polyhydroxyalkanoate depolymerase [Gemmatimonadales bacterium]